MKLASKLWLIALLFLALAIAMMVKVAKDDDARMLALVRQETVTQEEKEMLTSYYRWEWELTWPSAQFKTEYEAKFGKPVEDD